MIHESGASYLASKERGPRIRAPLIFPTTEAIPLWLHCVLQYSPILAGENTTRLGSCTSSEDCSTTYFLGSLPDTRVSKVRVLINTQVNIQGKPCSSLELSFSLCSPLFSGTLPCKFTLASPSSWLLSWTQRTTRSLWAIPSFLSKPWPQFLSRQ